MSANDRQVAGNHYKGDVQHWDLAAQHRYDYFQGQVTKYVDRWKKKNGLQDLKKAQHFLEKYIECVEKGIIEDPTVKTPAKNNIKRCYPALGETADSFSGMVKSFNDHHPDCAYPMQPCRCKEINSPSHLASTV